MFRDNVRGIVETLDSHEAGVYDDGRHVCRCGLSGTEAEWFAHVGEELEARFAEVVELPLGGGVGGV